MSRTFRIFVLIVLIVLPFLFLGKSRKKPPSLNHQLFVEIEDTEEIPEIALIFDDLGESLRPLKAIYALDIPVTVAVIPDLRFSKNVAYSAHRHGFSVLIHLPLEPKEKKNERAPYRFIGAALSRQEQSRLLRYYLNYLRIAIGFNNHMGSRATEDREFMGFILTEAKRRGLLFIDSRTSSQSVAYEVAVDLGMVCDYNEAFLDYSKDKNEIRQRLHELLVTAKRKGKIIVIAHPRPETFEVLEEEIPRIEGEVNFVTLKDYLL